MRRISYLVSTALVATSLASVGLSTPAFAAIGDLPSDAQARCEAAVPPPGTAEEDDEPGTPFIIEPVSIDVDGPTAVATGNENRFNFSGIGTPIGIGGDASNVNSAAQLYRNGNSPNLHALGLSATSQFPDSEYDYQLEFVDQTVFTFGCKVYKVRKMGAQAGTEIVPPGLQIPRTTPNVAPPLTATETGTPYFGPTLHANSGGGPVNSSAQVPVEFVVCISPNNTTKGKPGEWRIQNGAQITPANCTQASLVWNGGNLPNGNDPTSPTS